MNQPPDFSDPATNQTQTRGGRADHPLPQWRRPRGVAPGTWDYVNQRSIADHYDAFVADTPLCRLDHRILRQLLPGVPAAQDAREMPAEGRCQTRQVRTEVASEQDPATVDSPAETQEVVLDLGCGSGRSALPLAERGYCVVGVDLSQSMLEVMSQKTLASNGLVMPLRCNLVQLDCLASDSADHAICLFSTLGMIQGRVHRRKLLREAARIVRSGGSLLLHAHHRWAALREHRGFRGLVRSWWDSQWSRESEFGDTTYAYRGLDQMFMHRFSKHELLADLTDSGWKTAKVWPVAIDGSDVASSVAIPGGYLIHAEAAS